MSLGKIALGALGAVAIGYGVKKWLDSEMEKAGYNDSDLYDYSDVILDKIEVWGEKAGNLLDKIGKRLDKDVTI